MLRHHMLTLHPMPSLNARANRRGSGATGWRSSSSRPSSGTASNAAMPSRSTRVTSGSRDRTRSARAAAIWGTGAPVRPCMPTASSSSAAPPAHGRSRFGRDGAGGIHHAKQRRLDHVRQISELTACVTLEITGSRRSLSDPQGPRVFPHPSKATIHARGLTLYHEPLLAMLVQGSAGGSASPACSSSIEMPSGVRIKAMRPSRGGRLIVTP